MVSRWEGQAQNPRASVGKKGDKGLRDTLGEKILGGKNSDGGIYHSIDDEHQTLWLQCSLSCRVALEKQPDLSDPQFHCLKNGGDSKGNCEGVDGAFVSTTRV